MTGKDILMIIFLIFYMSVVIGYLIGLVCVKGYEDFTKYTKVYFWFVLIFFLLLIAVALV